MNPTDVAKSLPSAAECLKLAEANDAKSARTGWVLLNACVERADFTDLGALLRDPWLARVKKSHATPKLVARVVAHRGGKVGSDLARVQRAGIALHTMDQALSRASAMAGQPVLTRGDIREMNRSAEGWLLVVEETAYLSDVVTPPEPEDQEADDDSEDMGGGENATPDPEAGEVEQDETDPSPMLEDELTLRKTGRQLLIKASALASDVHEGPGWVFLLRFEGKKPCTGSSADETRTCVHAELDELVRVGEPTP